MIRLLVTAMYWANKGFFFFKSLEVGDLGPAWSQPYYSWYYVCITLILLPLLYSQKNDTTLLLHNTIIRDDTEVCSYIL